MSEYDACEQAYKNGYSKGKSDAEASSYDTAYQRGYADGIKAERKKSDLMEAKIRQLVRRYHVCEECAHYVQREFDYHLQKVIPAHCGLSEDDGCKPRWIGIE